MSRFSFKNAKCGIFRGQWLLGLCTSLCLVWGSPAVAGQNEVAQIEISGVDAEIDHDARSLITLKEGEPYSEEKLQESLGLLRQWKRFESSSVETKQTADGWVLHFHLIPGLSISSISFSGHFPYLTSRIRRHVGIHVGEIYRPEEVINEVKKVKRFFEREGYFATTVRVKEKINEKKGLVGLEFKINKGPRLRWRDIMIEGNEALPDGYFRSKLNTWIPYKPARLRKSLDRIKAKYQKIGYPRARVRVEKIHRDFTENRVDIVLRVKEHKQLIVNYRGNRSVSKKTLNKVTTFFREEAYDNYEVAQSVEAIQGLYRSRGFLEAKVSAEKTSPKPNQLQVDFLIEEGAQTLIKKIHINTQEDIEVKRVKSKLSLKEHTLFTKGYLSPTKLAQDEVRIPYLLRNEGYPESKVRETRVLMTPWKDRAHVHFDVEEGFRAIITAVSFEGTAGIPAEALQRVIQSKAKGPYSELAMQDDAHRLTVYYRDHGYPYVKVTPDAVFDPDTGNVEIYFVIEDGGEVRVDQILVLGIDQTRESTIRDALNIKEGDAYSHAAILKGESTLRKLGAFTAIKVDAIGLKENLDRVALLVTVEERKHYLFDFRFTYDTDNEATGSFTFTNLNLLGFGKRMSLILTLGQDIRSAAWNYIDPRLLGYDLEAITTLFIEDEDRPSFKVSRLGGSFSLLKEFGRAITLLGRYQLERDSFRGGTPDPDEETDDLTLPSALISFSYDTRDYFADPRKGLFGSADAEFFHPFFQNKATFVRLGGQISKYISPFRRFTFVNSFRMDGIIPLTTDTIVPRSELLFVGGDYSIRGFNEDAAGPLDADGDPIGQRFIFIHNMELQFRVVGNFKLAGFVDTANAADDLTINTGTLRHSAGVGLRYITPVGPVRLDYGVKLDKRSDEGIGRLHFTFGYAF